MLWKMALDIPLKLPLSSHFLYREKLAEPCILTPVLVKASWLAWLRWALDMTPILNPSPFGDRYPAAMEREVYKPSHILRIRHIAFSQLRPIVQAFIQRPHFKHCSPETTRSFSKSKPYYHHDCPELVLETRKLSKRRGLHQARG